MNAAITHPLNLIVIIIGSFLSLILGFFLLFNKKNKANLFLGVLILVFSTYYLTGFFDRFGLLVHLPHIIGISTVTPFLMGPLSYLYVSACTQKDFKMHRLSGLHFVPFILDVLFFMPFFLNTGAEKLDLFAHYMKTGDLQQEHYLLVLKALQTIVYIAIASRLIVRYIKHLNNTSSNIDHAFQRWMGVFLFLMTLPIFGLIGFVVLDYQKVLITIALMSLFAFLMVVFIMALVKPEVFQAFPYQMAVAEIEKEEQKEQYKESKRGVFHAFPHQLAIAEMEKKAQKEKYEDSKREVFHAFPYQMAFVEIEQEDQKEKYEGSTLDPSQKEDYRQKLIAYVESEKPYHAPELNIMELSNQVKIPVNHLSQVINEKLNVHFLDFINGYRIKEVKEKLADPKLSHFTILALAYESGFNAKSTFYAVFKKYTGMAPSEYRKLMASSGSMES
jgi:AraC-like DNA-binding protein